MVAQTMTTLRWIVHPGHGSPPWAAEMRRELVAAYRRGTMDAERCLVTYRSHGERSMLPREAVVYLAARVVAERTTDRPVWGLEREFGAAEVLSDHGERELAERLADDRAEFEGLVEAGRRIFFPVA